MNYINQIIAQHPYLVIIVSFLIGLAFMPVVLDIARKHNFVVKPTSVVLLMRGQFQILGLIFLYHFLLPFFFSFGIFSQLQFIILGVFIILIVGFVDDLIDLNVSWKLIGELAAAFFLDCSLGHSSDQFAWFYGHLRNCRLAELYPFILCIYCYYQCFKSD